MAHLHTVLVVSVLGQTLTLPELMERHKAGRMAVMQVYGEAEYYKNYRSNQPQLITQMRYAFDPERRRFFQKSWISPKGARPDTPPDLLKDCFEDSSHCYVLRARNIAELPRVLPKDFNQQEKQFQFQAFQVPSGAWPQRFEYIDEHALRAFVVLPIATKTNPSQRYSRYLEELVVLATRSHLRRKNAHVWEVTLYFEDPSTPTKLVFELDEQYNYAVTKQTTILLDSSGKPRSKQIREVKAFYREEDAFWPREIVNYFAGSEESANRLVVRKLVLNRPLPKEAFDFSIPKNAVVLRLDVPQPEIKEALVFGLGNRPVKVMTREQFAAAITPQMTTSPSGRTLWPVVATLGLLVLAGGLALWWRRAASVGSEKSTSENRGAAE